MKKLVIALLLVTGINSVTTAQTADEIINTSLENLGGVEKLRKIKNCKAIAKMNAEGMEISLTSIEVEDGRFISSYEVQGQVIVDQAFDGEIAWGTNMMNGKVEKTEAEELENIKREKNDFLESYLDYKERGYKVELLGKETIEGTECFKVKLIKNPLLEDGKEVENVEYYYFDTENYLVMVKEAELTDGEMRGSIEQTVYSDYQQVDGLYFAFSEEHKLKGTDMSQTINIEKIEINIELDDSMFEYPKQ